MTHRWAAWMVVIAVCVCAAPVVRAEQSLPPPQDKVDEAIGRYNLHPAFNKLGRGVGNALGGWMEIPLNVGTRYAQKDAVSSFFTGLAYGIVKGTVRTAVGVYETVTFFLPYPEDFAPILPTLEYYDKTPGRRPLPLE